MGTIEVIVLISYYTATIASAVWAAIDSSKIGLKRYRTGISYKPAVLCLLMIPLWYIAFPWYLIVRMQIKRGRIPLIEPSESYCSNVGLRSSKGKFGIVTLIAGIVVASLLAGVVFNRPPEEYAQWNPCVLWGLYGVLVLSVITIFIGAVYTLSAIVSGWRKKPRSTNCPAG